MNYLKLFNVNVSCVLFSMLFWKPAAAQTLQQVTDNGSSTTNNISASSIIANGNSFSGYALPTNISTLSGYRINGDIPNASHNGITYQSGSGGGAAIGFFREGAYETGIDFYTNALPGFGNIFHRMRIASNGNIGIGTLSPRTLLEVAPPIGNSAAGLFRLNGSQSYGHVLMLLTDSLIGDDPRILFSYRSGIKQWAIGGEYNTARFSIWENAGDGGYFGAGYGIERFTVEPGGNVGIGISDPSEKLSVNGKIRAKEIKVENTNWPDYVFADDYKLPTLEETEQHIKEKGHLEGLPSAEEVKANGIDLGEMNAKLLKKIEELTLHIIDQDKKLNEQNQKFERQISGQQLQIEKLKNNNEK